jgi:hypothetical protein
MAMGDDTRQDTERDDRQGIVGMPLHHCEVCNAPFPEYFAPEHTPPMTVVPTTSNGPRGHCRRCGTIPSGTLVELDQSHRPRGPLARAPRP